MPNFLNGYASLAQLNAETQEEKDLMLEWITALCNNVVSKKHPNNSSKALFLALHTLDPEVFGEDTRLLVQLAGNLLKRLGPEKAHYGRGSFHSFRNDLQG